VSLPTPARPARQISIIGVLAACLFSAGVLALTTPSAPAEVFGPVVVLGPTSIVNGTATVSGTVGATNSGAELTVNGQKLLVDSGGRFAGVVDLAGQSSLVISVKNPVSGKDSTTTIPLTTNIVGPGGLIGPNILDALEKAGVTLLEPVGGTGGLPVTISGNVADPSALAGLKINGEDALGTLDSNRNFSVTLPGTTKEITLSATDKQGVNQYFTVPVANAGSTIAAKSAQGVRISKVRYITKSVKRTKRLRMVVTVRDRRGYLIRGAVVRVRSAKAGRIVRNPKTKKTNRAGQAAFLLRARNRAFGKRLVMVTLAQTPSAKTKKNTGVQLPRLAKPAEEKR
jgi:hypothetical protein